MKRLRMLWSVLMVNRVRDPLRPSAMRDLERAYARGSFNRLRGAGGPRYGETRTVTVSGKPRPDVGSGFGS